MTGDFLLRDVVDDDLPIFFEQQSDRAAIHMVAFATSEPPQRAAFTAKWNKLRRDDTTTVKTILVDGKVVGNVLSFIAPWSGKREVGYWIGREYWGRGIATRALTEFLADEEPTRPIFAGLAKDNVGSLRVLQKCGFTVIGEAREFADARGTEIEELFLELRAGG